ncbi:uncharacterized protein OCT59_022611 [Rhizophagus irregularis]|uniref:uncharacterized protein n=1 Tax=Rhizophagus irregularis TaxID=588596 RepID=UPI00332F9329|nr:hypothetical protein OCT59_022611 [Rhizophagus irregularis]
MKYWKAFILRSLIEGSEGCCKISKGSLRNPFRSNQLYALQGRSTCEKQDIKHVGICGSSANFPQKLS